MDKDELKAKIKRKLEELKARKASKGKIRRDKHAGGRPKIDRGVHRGEKGAEFVITESGSKHYINKSNSDSLHKSIKGVLYSVLVKSFIKKFKEK